VSSFRIRPRFTHTLDLGPSAARDLILRSLATQAPNLEVKPHAEFIGIHIAEGERRYWSPRLFLGLEATAAGTTRVEGTYGPEIEIWGISSTAIFSPVCSARIPASSAAPNFSPGRTRGLSGSPGAMALIAALLYLSAQLGQKFGAWQTFQLHQAYQNAIGRPAEIH